MRTYPLSLGKYDISREEYRELYWFCRRYPEMRMRADQILRGAGAWLTGMPRSGQPSDPTAQAALRRDKLVRDCEMIEQAAIEASPECYEALLKNVTLGDTYERIGPYCGRRQFFEMRRRFFFLLSLKRDTAGQYKRVSVAVWKGADEGAQSDPSGKAPERQAAETGRLS